MFKRAYVHAILTTLVIRTVMRNTIIINTTQSIACHLQQGKCCIFKNKISIDKIIIKSIRPYTYWPITSRKSLNGPKLLRKTIQLAASK